MNKPEEWELRYDKWVREHAHLTEPGRELEAEKEFFDFIRTELAKAREEERERLAREVRKMENQNITQKEVLKLLKTNQE